MDDVTKLLQEGVAARDFPGAAYAIIYKEGYVNFDFVGYRQLEPNKIENKGNEIYDCASLTKVVCTTTMIMKLIEEERLALDTPLWEILPRFRHKQVLISHLLTHSSGLPADISRAKTLASRTEVLDKIFAFDLIYPTGEKVIYSDIGYILLGLVIEQITGLRLDVYADRTIFRPLGMKDSSYRPDTERVAPTEYRDDEVFTGWLKGRVHDEKSFAMGGLAGHAGLFSTTRDLAKFILSFLRNDGLVLKPETVDSLFPLRIRSENSDGTVLVRSYGWNKPTKGGTAGDLVSFDDTILHTGFTGCNIWIDRSLGIGFVMLSNAVHPHREMNNIIKYRNKIANMIVANKEE